MLVCWITTIFKCYYNVSVLDEFGIKSQWQISHKPGGISVTTRRTVIVSLYQIGVLLEFTSTGESVREIHLQSDIGSPWHAIQLDDNRYAVANGKKGNGGLHRVCIVNGEGLVLRCFGGEEGNGRNRLRTPIRMALLGGALVVADLYNRRLVVLDVESLTVMVDQFEVSLDPVRMAIDKNCSRIYIVDNEYDLDNKCSFSMVYAIELEWGLIYRTG